MQQKKSTKKVAKKTPAKDPVEDMLQSVGGDELLPLDEYRAHIDDLRKELVESEARAKALQEAYEKELEKEPAIPANITKGKVLCGMVVRRIEESAWGHKATEIIGEGLVNELREYANEDQ